MNKIKFGPVAEFMGVALLEKAGDIKKVYNGQAYYTDGMIHCLGAGPDGEHVLMTSFKSEEDAYLAIPQMADEERSKYFNYVQVLKLLGMEDVEMPKYGWEWNPEKKMFLQRTVGKLDIGKRRINLRD